MPSAADYRCRECGVVQEFVFDGPPPATHLSPHNEQATALFERQCLGAFDRLWTAPHTGRGSSGEPPR